MWNRLKRDDRGAAMVMAIVMMLLFVGITAVAIDLGRYSLLKSRLQNAADAAATAGASAYDYDALYNRREPRLIPSQAQSLANQYFWGNNLTGIDVNTFTTTVVGPTGQCQPQCSYAGTTYTAPTVVVRATGTAGRPFFGRIFGAQEYRIDVQASASLGNRFETIT